MFIQLILTLLLVPIRFFVIFLHLKDVVIAFCYNFFTDRSFFFHDTLQRAI